MNGRAYFPLLMLMGFVVVNAALMLLASHLSIRARPTPVKQTAYESGIPPLGDARERFSVKFYMVAMLFIVFDIETVFMIPWGASFRELSCAVPLVAGACPAGRIVVLRARRNAGVHSDPARRLRLRLEEGSAAMGLTAPPDRTVVTHDPPDQESWIATRLDFLVNWGRANSLWPMPFGTACCAIEFMATAASQFDLARFGMERMSFSPAPGRRADLRRSRAVQAGAGHSPHLAADAAAEVVHLDGRVRIVGRHVRQLRGGAGDRHDHPRGRVRARLPAAPRGAHLRHPDAAAEGDGEKRMSNSTLRNEMEPDPESGLYIPPQTIDELSEPFGNSVQPDAVRVCERTRSTR